MFFSESCSMCARIGKNRPFERPMGKSKTKTEYSGNVDSGGRWSLCSSSRIWHQCTKHKLPTIITLLVNGRDRDLLQPHLLYSILCSHNQLITSEKKKQKPHQKRAGKKKVKKVKKWFASTESIRTEGQWVIHLLVQHNYLFFFPSFTSLFIWDIGVPANQKNTLFVIIQIKHQFLRENVCQTTMQRELMCSKNKLPCSQMREFY